MSREEMFAKLRNTLVSMQLPGLWPVENREDAAHNVIGRLLEAAKERGVDLATLLESNPQILAQKIEAERSRVRRLRRKLGRQMSAEMAAALPADCVPSEIECVEVMQKAATAAALIAKEKQFIYLYYFCGVTDYGALSSIMKITRAELYRLHHEAKTKLRSIPSILKLLLDFYVHHPQPGKAEDGT
jgi:hypothetical protein